MDFIGKKQGFIDTGVFLAMFVFSSKKRVGVFGYPCFWAENKGGFVCGDFGYLRYWAKIKGGGFKKVKKLKKSGKKFLKRGKKEEK